MSLYPSNEAFLAATGGAGGTGVFPIEIFTGTSKNLIVADNKKFHVLENISTITVTIPDNAAEAFPISSEIEFLRFDTGVVTFAVSGAAVLVSRDSLITINAQYSVVTLKKIDTDEWVLIGDLA